MSKDAIEPRRVAVIGAGIVGMSCALFLQRDGHRVSVFDPAEPGSMTSYGNACSISMSSVLPTAVPGLARKLPAMLLDPTGPLNVRLRYLPRLLPFLIAFLRNTTAARLDENSRAIAGLIHHVMDAYRELTAAAGAASLIRQNGALKVYESDGAFAGAAMERELLTRYGCRFEILDAGELRQLEPALHPRFRRAMFLPDSGNVTNPARLVRKLAEALAANGGVLVRERVVDVQPQPGTREKRILTDAGEHLCDSVVLAAGPWSGPLARRLGAPVRLEAERGYHVMLPEPPVPLRRFVYFADRKFVLTPHEEGLRLTTGVEYARVDAPPDYRRVRALIPQAAQMVRDLDPTEQSVWCGNRPTLPDSVPVIGRSPRDPDVYLAFGHSHLGLTLGPITGRVIADLVAGRDPGLDLSAYRADRPAA